MFNNMKKKLFKDKFKNNKGSAMLISIVAMALLLIFVPYMTKQISNQFKSTSDSYKDIKEKYLAEAGIERSISEIENQVKATFTVSNRNVYSKQTHHPNDNCPKVNFDENGNPDWGQYWGDAGNTFYKLIYYEIIDKKSNVIYNKVLNENWKAIFGEDSDIRLYYETNIMNLIKELTITHDKNKLIILEKDINDFIIMMEDAKAMVNSSNGTQFQKNQAIDGYNQMIGYMEEIKCRLGMKSTDVGETTQDIEIEVPYYDVTLDDNDNFIFDKNTAKSKKFKITIKRENGNIIGIDFTNINNTLIGANAYDYEISADIDFSYINKSTSYSIDQSVNSYNRVK